LILDGCEHEIAAVIKDTTSKNAHQNLPPIVNAGHDQLVEASSTATLSGTAVRTRAGLDIPPVAADTLQQRIGMDFRVGVDTENKRISGMCDAEIQRSGFPGITLPDISYWNLGPLLDHIGRIPGTVSAAIIDNDYLIFRVVEMKKTRQCVLYDPVLVECRHDDADTG